MLKKLLVSFALGAGLILQAASPSSAAISNGMSVIRDSVAQDSSIAEAQFIFGGRNYCWYDNGWRGPGWYWCGYELRRGFGWGGGVGWNNWHHRPGHGGHHRPGHGGGGHRPGHGHGGGGHHRPGHGGGGHHRPGHGGGGGHRGGGGGGHRRR